MFYCRCFPFLFFFSPRDLRAPAADRRETLPHDRYLGALYNASPKIRGALPPKKLGAKNMQNSARLHSAIKCVYESWRWTLWVSVNCLLCCLNHDELYASHYKIRCVFRSANIPWTPQITTWSPKKFNNFVIIKNNTMLLSTFMLLCDYERVINVWNFVKIPSGC